MLLLAVMQILQRDLGVLLSEGQKLLREALSECLAVLVECSVLLPYSVVHDCVRLNFYKFDNNRESLLLLDAHNLSHTTSTTENNLIKRQKLFFLNLSSFKSGLSLF